MHAIQSSLDWKAFPIHPEHMKYVGNYFTSAGHVENRLAETLVDMWALTLDSSFSPAFEESTDKQLDQK